MREIPQLAFENASLLFVHFSNEKTANNRYGTRGFNVEIFDPEEAKALSAAGWKIKPQKLYDPEKPMKWMLPVKIDFSKPDQYPCVIWMYSNGVPTQIDETTINDLQYANISNIDITVNGGRSLNNQTGEWETNAYLATMHITVVTDNDKFKAKYASFHKPDEEPIPFN